MLKSSETVQMEVLQDADLVGAKLRERGAVVHANGLLLEVTTTDTDPYDLITQVLAETGTGIRLLRPAVETLEDVYLSEEHGAR